MTAAAPVDAPQPLTQLTGEESMFQASVRAFARKEIGPWVREMDEAGVFRKDILAKLFEMGLIWPGLFDRFATVDLVLFA